MPDRQTRISLPKPMLDRLVAAWLPRALHPGAWWIWALGLAAAATRTTNPILLLLIIAVVSVVVMARRPDTPWARSFRIYLMLGLVVVIFRVVFRLLFGGFGPTVLFTLPSIQLPEIMAGVHLLGAVSAEALLGAFYDGLRLATMIICVGAANSLANPKRLLACVPPALYEIGTVLIVSVSVFPQLAESTIRVKRARALRAGHRRGRKALRGIVIPVLADALDRSLLLAAAMDSRGYGRRAQVPRRQRLLTSALLTAGVIGLCIGVYGILDATTPRYLGLPMMIGGVLIGAVGFRLAGRRVHRTRYRPDHWRVPELFVAACGVVAGTTVWVTSRIDPAVTYPSLFPISWPAISLLPLLGILLAALPAVLTPPPPGSAGVRGADSPAAASPASASPGPTSPGTLRPVAAAPDPADPDSAARDAPGLDNPALDAPALKSPALDTPAGSGRGAGADQRGRPIERPVSAG